MHVQRFAGLLLSLIAALSLSDCGGGASAADPSTTPVGATAPTITEDPTDQVVARGQTATFAIVATGRAPLTYQWQKNSVPISGANSATYTTPAATDADDGSQFHVVVSNSVGSAKSKPARLSVTTGVAAASITTQPASQIVIAGQTATFTVSAEGSVPLSYQWQKNGTTIPGATSASYTTPATGAGDNGSHFQAIVSNSATKVTSNTATLTVVPGTDVLTYHNDNARTGQNLTEGILSASNVNPATFGKTNFLSVDGKVDAQPLYLSNVAVPGQRARNMLYVVTEHDSVYAFDADTGEVIWQVSVLGTGETTSDPRGCDQVRPEIGITATPVIDRTRGPNGAIYLIAMSKDGAGNYFQRLHALDVTTGAELFGGPKAVQASFPGTGANSSGGNVIFDAKQYKERAGLLLLDGVVYTGWSSHCDFDPYTGWIMAYDASTLGQTSVLNVTPNGSEGSIWGSGAGPAADIDGNIYVLDANGTFDPTLDGSGFPSKKDFGNAFLKLSTSSGLAIVDYFATTNTIQQSSIDNDLGSGGAMVLPDLTDSAGHVQHLAVGAGKDGNIYVVNRGAMGKFNADGNHIYQEIQGGLSGTVFSSPAYFNGTIYYGAVADNIKAFVITDAQVPSFATSLSNNSFDYPGTTPSISANGTSDAILWAVENGNPAVLHAYDATDLAKELFSSNQAASSRDNFGQGNKYIVPTIANGKVFVGTTNGVAVFGLLP